MCPCVGISHDAPMRARPGRDRRPPPVLKRFYFNLRHINVSTLPGVPLYLKLGYRPCGLTKSCLPAPRRRDCAS